MSLYKILQSGLNVPSTYFIIIDYPSSNKNIYFIDFMSKWLLLFYVDALTDILDAFVISENAAKMRMARENAGNDMLKVMQTVFPITVQIQMDVIKNYGFTADGDGVYYFSCQFA